MKMKILAGALALLFLSAGVAQAQQVPCFKDQGGAAWVAGSGCIFDGDGQVDVFVLDSDGDTTISSPSDDTIDIEIGGADDFTLTANKFDVLSGSTLEITGVLSISGTTVSATAAELNITDNMPASITFAAASAGTDIADVTITVQDAAAATIASVFNLDVWLSDDSACAGLTATSASGTVTVKSASGAVIGTLTSKKALRVQTLATGVFILEITDTAKTAFFPCASLPSTGGTEIGAVLATGDYG